MHRATEIRICEPRSVVKLHAIEAGTLGNNPPIERFLSHNIGGGDGTVFEPLLGPETP